jgi:hypothetical protein
MTNTRTPTTRAAGTLRMISSALTLVLVTTANAEAANDKEWAATAYVAQVSSEDRWEDVFFDPFFSSYAHSFLLVAALSKRYALLHEGDLQLEVEGNVAYAFDEQHYWQLNFAPLMARWQKFPWNHSVETSAAFGLGLSYATELPELEVKQEGDSSQLLVFWVAEVTAGPPGADWAISLRLHHRSVGYGLFGDKGGMNAVGLGVRYMF